jgi:hypothetical protein
MSCLSIGLPRVAEFVRLKREVVVVSVSLSHARGEAGYEHNPDRDNDWMESKRSPADLLRLRRLRADGVFHQ